MIQRSTIRREPPFYIESDGKPMGETQQHIENLRYLLEPLDEWFADRPAGVRGRQHVRPLRARQPQPPRLAGRVRGPRRAQGRGQRRNYLVWEEGHAPNFVVELTSESTREEDQTTKRAIYQDVLHVSEYFLFDPFEEYLHPRLQGYRLAKGVYRPIRPVKGRLPSKVLGLHLEADGDLLRLYDPTTHRRLPIPSEVVEAKTGRSRGRAPSPGKRRVAPPSVGGFLITSFGGRG